MLNLFSKRNFIPEILIILFPVALISGPLIPEIFMLIINTFFLYFLIRSKNFGILNNKLLIMLFFFTIYILILSYLSKYSDEIFFRNIFYFRFIIFVTAIYYFIRENVKLMKLIFLSIMMCFTVLAIDGSYQFYFNENILGFKKIRADRISSFFEDKLVLGSYISRYFFIFIGLYFYLEKNLSKKLKIFSVAIILLSFLIIVLSGERAALFLTIIGLLALYILINISYKKKLLILLASSILIVPTLVFNNTLNDRYIKQTLSQVLLTEKNQENFFERFVYYSSSWQTAYKAFLDNKFFGQGPKSFKYFCSDPEFVTYNKRGNPFFNNYQFLNIHKKFLNVQIVEISKKVGDEINHGDLILKFKHRKKIYNFYADRIGKIKTVNVSEGQSVSTGLNLFTLDLSQTGLPDTKLVYKNGCTTHPHQLYLQLLSETGFVGALTILSLFLTITYIFVKHLIERIFFKSEYLQNSQISILISFFLLLFPFTTFGSFFNNWFVMSFSMQVGILFYFLKIKKNK